MDPTVFYSLLALTGIGEVRGWESTFVRLWYSNPHGAIRCDPTSEDRTEVDLAGTVLALSRTPASPWPTSFRAGPTATPPPACTHPTTTIHHTPS